MMDNFRSLTDLFSWSMPFFITTSKGGFYFNLFYILAFLLATGWLVGEGYKRNLHLLTWLIVLAFSRIFFIIGTKVISYSNDDWAYVWNNLELVPTSSKVVLGGLFLGMAAVVLMIKIFRLPLRTLDTFAFVLPMSMAVQRIGCFLIGCCFGKPTTLPIGVSYGHGTLPHFHQYKEGLIEASTMYSLPIHPFQLYEALNGILVVIILWQYRKKLLSPGSLLALSLGLSAAFRFCLEFFRDSSAHAMGGNLIGGMKVMQWLLIFTALIAICFLLINEKRKFPLKPSTSVFPIYPLRLLGVLMFSVLITWSLREWFLPVELLVLNIVLFPAIILAIVHFFQASAYPQYKWLTMALLMFPVFLMSQTWKVNEKSPDSTRQKSYDTFRTGLATGKIHTVVAQRRVNNDGCVQYEYDNFENVYWNFAAGYSRTKIKEKGELTYGADLVGGNYKERNLEKNITNNYPLFAIHPFIRYNHNWFGIGAGFYLGQNYLALPRIDIPYGRAIPSTVEKNSIYPSLYGRIGPERIFFVDGGIAQTFPSPFPGMQHEFALGSGFGLPKGNRLRYGLSPFGNFIHTEILPNQNYQFSASYVWGTSYLVDDRNNRQFLFGLQYRFNHK